MRYELTSLKEKPRKPEYIHQRWIFNRENKLKKTYVELIKQMAQDMTYKEIALTREVSLGVIFGMVENLMNHLKIRKRTSLVIWALKNGYLNIDDL
jgi:DNA-binding NarL/FixJ family response regulator